MRGPGIFFDIWKPANGPGKNIVIEARSAILDFLFDELKMHKVLGKPHGRNFSSIFNYKAMGFACEAVLREQMLAIDDDTTEVKTIADDTMTYLTSLSWPGNVRQLENTCHWLAVMTPGQVVHISDLPAELIAELI